MTDKLKVRLGSRWADALKRYKLTGVFIWCDAEGNFTVRPKKKRK